MAAIIIYMKDDQVTLYIEDTGDRSVGIGSESMSIDLSKYWIEDKEQREFFRKDAVELFKKYSDMPVRYSFYSDECPECGSFLTESPSPICSNQHCLSNFEMEDGTCKNNP
jgi:hypothetical protein